ncbi:DUF885 domain-containing protein [Qipengyuania sp. S6317L1]|uniref:DUF885 domain-containing protein n=1 Tax=Qipengyuania sp. S6317L1 TaxID=2926410 RepID=UPI001FF39F39|nr:DUF885 domain-containing protein [Qipengyuania sp. S6317L1]MCK0098326.1 DUF885 domain-containing protein [Qipengyuania sp. S6317L1]
MTNTQFSLTRRQTLAGLSATTALTLTGCKMTALDGPVASLTPDDWLEQVGYNLLGHEPERATSLGVDVGQYAGLRGKLEDQSQAGQDALAATLRRDLDMTKAYPRDNLTPEQLTSFEAVESGYQVALDGLALPYGDIPVGSWRTAPYVVIQNVGSYLDLPRFMDSGHPVSDGDDAEFFLERMKQMPAVFDGELDRMKSTADLGVIPPAFLLDKAIAQMESTIATAGQADLFTSSLSRRSAEAGIANAPVEEAARVERGEIVDALTRQLEELKRQRAKATNDAGMRERPYGEEWYTWALRSSTTTNLTADEIHNQGLEELEALHARMDPILREIGFTKGTVGERMQGLSQDPRYKFSEGDPGRAEIMAFIKDRINWIKGEMPRAFNTLVDPNLEVRRLPLSEEPGAPGAYGGAGSKDGTIPGRMWINLRTTDLHRKYDLADLTYHETIPGHVWEGEYSNRLPLIRSILAFNPFSEGWALYAEQLADELGAYDDFKVGRLGYLQSLAFRACRMVVDTGLHSKGWSRERAVNFFVERNGSKEQEVASEVDRYCSWPGQATGYKLGHSRIVDLRARAQRELGDAYDLKAFNDAIILGGNAPMDVLAKNVARYIDGAKG